jgi:hypothetical protein
MSESPKSKILIIGVHGPYEPWLSILKNGQLSTWSKNTNENVRVVHAMGKPVPRVLHKIGEYVYNLKWSPNKLIGYIALIFDKLLKIIVGNILFDVKTKDSDHCDDDCLIVNMPDYSVLMGNKMLSILKYASDEMEFDYLVTTISSTYINLSNLENFVATIPKKNVIAGKFVKLGDEYFQQGAFRLYSRDVIDFIIDNRKKYNQSAPEDVAMGRLVKNNGFTEYEVKNNTIDTIESASEVQLSSIEDNIYLRCKGATEHGNKLRNDVKIMSLIHKKLEFK